MSTRDERRDFIALSEACAMWEALQGAKTLEALDALNVEWIGHSRVEDDPAVDAYTLRDDLQDYIREVCYSTGVHCEDVFGDDA